VYYYEIASLPSAAAADTIIDNLTALEKTFHSSGVTFVRGRLWSQQGSPATNEMISQKNLSGTGARSALVTLDRERAFLFRIRAGVDSRGTPVYLRKWFHACGEFVAAQGIGNPALANQAGFTGAERAAQRDAMQAVSTANGSTNITSICSKNGRQPSAGSGWEAHAFLEHHQLGDQWRAT